MSFNFSRFTFCIFSGNLLENRKQCPTNDELTFLCLSTYRDRKFVFVSKIKVAPVSTVKLLSKLIFNYLLNNCLLVFCRNIVSPHSSSNSQCKSERAMPVSICKCSTNGITDIICPDEAWMMVTMSGTKHWNNF